MSFSVKDWRNATSYSGGGDTSTPLTAEALEDLETRVTDYSDLTAGLPYMVPSGTYSADDTGVSATTDAINQALSDADSAGGSNVYVGPGDFLQDDIITVPETCNLIGLGGRVGSRLFWSSEINNYAMQTTTTGVSSRNPTIQGFEIDGPGNEGATIGTQPSTNTYGIKLNDNGIVRDCYIHGFRNGGVCIVGNHQSVFDCRIQGCYYGIYFDGGAASFEDQLISNCVLASNLRAGIGIHGENVIGTCTFATCHIGWTPYGIYKESSGAYNKHAISYSLFNEVAFEQIGNAIMIDQGMDKDWGGVTFISGGAWGLSSTYKIPAEAADHLVDVHNAYDWYFSPGRHFTVDANGPAVSVFNFDNAWGRMEIQGGSGLIGNVTASVPVLTAANNLTGDFIITTSTGAKCRVMKLGGAAGNAAAKQLLYHKSGIAGVLGCSIQGSDIPVGVAQTAINDGNWGILAVEGKTDVLCHTGGAAGSYAVLADTATRGKVDLTTADHLSDALAVGFAESGTGDGDATIYLTQL